MKYNSDKFKQILIPVELKDELDTIKYELIMTKVRNKEKNIEVSYGEIIKAFLDMYKERHNIE